MKLPDYIKPKPYYLRYIPYLNKYVAYSFYPWIFIPRDIYNDLKSTKPNPYHIALLEHEFVHHNRQKEKGWVSFGIKYLLSSDFRIKEVVDAVKKAIKYLKTNKMSFKFDKSNKRGFEFLYLWPVSKYYDEKQLKNLWESV